MKKRATAVLLMVLMLFSVLPVCAEDEGINFLATLIETIEERAFYLDTSITEVLLPDNITEIQKEAFKGCTSLEKVTCLSRDVKIDDTAFDGAGEFVAECFIGSTMDEFAEKKGLKRSYLDACEVTCNTVNNGCAGLPITWTAFNVMPGSIAESTFQYHLYKDGELVLTTDETSEKTFRYTPETKGEYHVEVVVKNDYSTSKVASQPVPVADKLYMGIFEQDNVASTADPVEWQIIGVEGDKAFVISKYILRNNSFFNPYWLKYKYCYWSGSYIGTAERVNYLGNTNGKLVYVSPTSIPLKDGSRGTDDDLFYTHCRYWCNETFYKGAFNEEEKERILLTTNVNQDSPYGIEGGPDTQDYVFFLSLDELLTYFPDKASRAAKMTKTAKSQLSKGKPEYWWLRTNGKYRVNAMMVYASGGYSEYGNDVGHDDVGYRPAMWISIGG